MLPRRKCVLFKRSYLKIQTCQGKFTKHVKKYQMCSNAPWCYPQCQLSYQLKSWYLYLDICIQISSRASLVAQMVKNQPAMQETPIQYLGWEDPLEKGLATDSSVLAWNTLWTEESGSLKFMGVAKSRTWLSD